MAFRYILRSLGPVALILCALLARGQSRSIVKPSRLEQARLAEISIKWLEARLTFRELTGHNDGPKIAGVIKAGGGRPETRPEYCGYTQAADQLAAGLPIPVGAGRAANWFIDRARLVYNLGKIGSLDSIRRGHVVGIWSASRGCIGHVTRVKEPTRAIRAGRQPRGFMCLGGNEGSGVNAGFHLTFYPASSIRAGADYLVKYAPHSVAVVTRRPRKLRPRIVATAARTQPAAVAAGARLERVVRPELVVDARRRQVEIYGPGFGYGATRNRQQRLALGGRQPERRPQGHGRDGRRLDGEHYLDRAAGLGLLPYRRGGRAPLGVAEA